jgi:hypothetical protein
MTLYCHLAMALILKLEKFDALRAVPPCICACEYLRNPAYTMDSTACATYKVCIHTHVSVTWDMMMDTARYCKTVALAVPTVL